MCGTSVGSPLVAGIMAHMGAEARTLAPESLYANSSSFLDLTRGYNGDCLPPAEHEYFCHAQGGYTAQPDWAAR